MIRVKINGKEYCFFGSVNGSNSNIWHKATKLAYMFNELDSKLAAMAKRGNYDTHVARCATAVRMMMYTGIRVGNESSAEGYMTKPHPNDKKRKPEFVQTFGLTTLKPEHIEFNQRYAKVRFAGKKCIENFFQVTDKELVRALKTLHKEADGTVFGVSHYELSKFVKKYVGRQFTPKDFRTMRANMYAWEKWCELPYPSTKKELNALIKEVAVHVSEHLNNTPAVCKRSYIDDGLFEHMAGNLNP